MSNHTLNLETIQREEIPYDLDIYVVAHDGIHLEPAEDELTEDIRGSLRTQRNQLLTLFGTNEVPGLATDQAEKIAKHFEEFGTSISRFVVIDPVVDQPKVREILSNGFLGDPYINFFAGTQEEVSPGLSQLHDLVIFHDWRERYRKIDLESIAQNGRAPRDVDLDELLRLHILDLVTHEAAHTAIGNAVRGVVIEKVNGRYALSYKSTFDFEPLKSMYDHPAVIEQMKEGDYYNGELLCEGMAARHSVEMICERFDPDSYDYVTGTLLYADVRLPNGTIGWLSCGQIQSADAYIGLQGMFDAIPGFREIARQAELGVVTAKEFNLFQKEHIPPEVRALMYTPSNSAWQEIKKLYPDKRLAS